MTEQNTLKHIAIIMDGNGRWAQSRGHNRFWGHVRGAKAAQIMIEECAKLKIPYLTLFAFSTENWQRPKQEVDFLMKLLCKQLIKESKSLVENNIKFMCIGDTETLPSRVRKIIDSVVQQTQNNTGMTLNFALNYSGQSDIIRATTNIAQAVLDNKIAPSDINSELISEELLTAHSPDPDLIIRTSGEKRISNFMLWQSAYSEFYFSDKMWPEFNRDDLNIAINYFNNKKRRFGKTNEQVAAPTLTAQPQL